MECGIHRKPTADPGKKINRLRRMNQTSLINRSAESMVICPVCNNEETRFALKVKDHSVSAEFFDVFECSRCNLRFTKDPPPGENIGTYYESEDYISHSNTRKGLINNLYHTVRNRTLTTKYHLLERSTGLKTAQHLDIGAGTGAFVQYMNRKGWNSIGVEPDERARDMALAYHETKLLPAGDFESFSPESFDAISMWHVLEHVHALYPYLQQIKNILKPGGLVFIAVPNYTSYDAVKYGANWAAYDVPRHLYHFSPVSMKWLLKTAGFQLTKIVPMWWDSFYISLLSEKYAGGHASLLKGFVTGAISNLKAMGNKEKCSSLIYIAERLKA
jgi:2-polyprenyl-3-methyl-5-hydroxy-6-metoxy-1,4-benzoquinol methylase